MAAVFLDPGHGGRDPGPLTTDGRHEADSSLCLGLMLQPMLLENHHSVRLSRERDIGLSLEQRVTMAWAWGADLFISLHCDCVESPRPRGYHVIRSLKDPAGQRGDRLGRLLIQGISDCTGNPPFARWGGPVWTKRQYPFGPDYYAAIRWAMGRGIHAAVIIERGFLRNPDDARLLFDDEYLQMEAEGIVAAVNRYGIM